MTDTAGQSPFIRTGQGNAERLKVWVESFTITGGSLIEPEKNGVTAIVGANNSGKSTLLNCLHQALTPSNYGNIPQLLEEPVNVAKEGTRDDLIEWLHQHAHWGRSQFEATVGYRRMAEHLPDTEITGWDIYPPSAGFWTHYFPADGYAGNFGSERAPVGAAPQTPSQVLYERPALMKQLDSICFDVFGEQLTLDDESPNFNLLVGRPSVNRPGPDDDKGPFRTALGQLNPLQAQGHGMRSWLTVITQLITGTYPIILADEPEVFLHPPQARALGIYLSRLARANNCQVILATHDRNLLTGLLEEGSNLTVVRLDRTPARTYAHQLPAAKVRELWSDPLLRYGNALDGLFHRAVIVAEAHGDCTFYRAALDHYQSEASEKARNDGPGKTTATEPPPKLSASDVLFVPSNGKHAMPKLVSALTAVKVPVVATPDLDILNPTEPVLKNLVAALSPEEWSKYDALHRKSTQSLTTPTALTEAAFVRDRLVKVFDELLADNADAVWNSEVKKSVLGVLRAAGGPSDRLKHEGTNYAAGEELQALEQLLAELHTIGIVPVELGELERFARKLNQNNKTLWLEQALESKAYIERPAQEHVAKLIRAALNQTQARRL